MTRLNAMPRNLVQGLVFDGSQNYLSLGTLGILGANLGSGFYMSFQIAATIFGNYSSIGVDTQGANTIVFYFNPGSNNPGQFKLRITDNSNNVLEGQLNSAINITDGNLHTIEITANPSANTITINVDGTAQSVNINQGQTPSSFVNLANPFYVGAKYIGGIAGCMPCTIYNFKIGISSSSLYGNYQLLDGTGTIAKDISGKGNNATLNGSPLPTWITRKAVT